MKSIEVLNIRKNIMSTISIEMKIKGMRKPQDFIVYGIAKGDKSIKIQSSTRIASIGLNGIGKVTKSYSGGAYFHHLMMANDDIEFSKHDWRQIVEYIGLTEGESVGNSVIKSNNSGAKSIFGLD